jgi:protein-tyrosine phosphatase
MYDVHSHILFGVDDGARSFEESQAMVHAAHAVGIDRIVCTPHFHDSRFDMQLVERNFELLEEFAKQQGIEMLLGFEVYWRTLLEAGIENAPEFNIDDSNLLLLEFGYHLLPPHWQRLIFDLQAMGLRVIIAHPERYAPIQKDIGIAEEMKRMGCLLQLSANFVAGSLFGASRKTALSLMKYGLVDYIASDAHCPADYDYYPKALSLWDK